MQRNVLIKREDLSRFAFVYPEVVDQRRNSDRIINSILLYFLIYTLRSCWATVLSKCVQSDKRNRKGKRVWKLKWNVLIFMARTSGWVLLDGQEYL